MPQYYSKTVYTDSAGGESTFALDFNYKNQEDVIVTLNGIETADFTWSSPSTISLNTPTVSGDDVALFRRTDLDNRAVDFENAAELTEADLDASAQQVFDAMQEVKDVAADSFTPRPDGSLSLSGRKLSEVGEPEQPSDAATKGYIDSKILSNETFRDETIAARDETLSARDETLVFKGEAETSRNGAEFFAGQSETVFNDLTTLINNLDAQTILPALPSNELKLLQVNASGTNTEWVDISGYTGFSQYYLKTEADAAFLGKTGKAINSSLLNGRADQLLPNVDTSITASYEFALGILSTWDGIIGATDNFGSAIWSLSDAYGGGTAGTDYDPQSQYGISWIRGGNAEYNSYVGEGLYVYRNGVLRGGVGHLGIYSTGDIQAAGDVRTTSDASVKRFIEPHEHALHKLQQISGNTYVRTDIKKIQDGVIAQEVEEVLPNSVHRDEDGLLSVNYNGVVSLLVEAVKELSREVEELRHASNS